MNSLFHSIIIIILIATQSILCHSNSRIWSDLQECRVCDGRHVDALFIVDVTKSTASKGSYVRAISQYIEYRVDELDMISFDKQTDLSLNHALYGRSAVIVDDTVLFNLDGFPVFDTFQENLQGSNSLQIKSQLELASLSVFPLVNDTTELLVYYLSDRFPILSDDEQLPCDENNVPLVDPLRGDYFFVSLNDNLEGVEYLSSCLNVYPHHDHDNVFETEQQYAFLNEFQTQKVGGSRVVTIEGEGTEDTIYSHVCGIDCCHVNSTWYPRFPYHDNITAPTLYDEDQDRTLSELDILFTTDDDMAINQVFIEEVSILLFATAYTMFMDARLYLKVMDGSTVTWLSLTPNAPATYGDPESNAFKLLLYEEYDDLVTLIPGRDYKIEVRFFGTNAAARYMSIPDDPSKTDDECQSRLDCDLEGYFTEIEFQAMYGLNTIESLDDSVAMYMNFGCLFEPRDASKPITTTPSPEPICAGIQTPGNYGKCNGDTQTPEDMDWDFKFYGARYDAVLDITELTYAIMVQYNSIENVVEIRLQLPCDCLMDNCMLSALLYDSNPEVEVEDGMFVWSIEVENSRTYILNLELRGRLDQSISDNGQYALYGKRKTCAYGGNIEVPQPCRCWGDWQQISDTCDDPSCGMGQQVDQRYCDTECAFGGYEYYGKCNKYDYDVTDMSQWEHGCFGGDTTETTCDRGCCDCDDWDTWSEWGDCEYNSVYKKIYKTRIRTCNTVESDTVYLCDGQAVDMEAEVCEVPTSSPITSTPTTTVITTDTTQGATPTPLAPDLDTTELPQTTSEEITTSSVTEDVGTTAQPPQTTTETSLETTAEPIETTATPTDGTDAPQTTPSDEVTTTDTSVPDTTSLETTDVTEVSDLPITPEPQTTAVIITTKSEDIITTTEEIATTGVPTDTPQTTTGDVITTTESSVSDTVSPDTTQDGTVETTIAPGTTDVPETTTEDVVTTLEPDTTGVEPQTTVEVDTTISAPDTTVMDTTTELPGTTVESTGTPQTTPQVDVTTTETIIPDTTTAIETTDATSAPTGDVVTTPTPTEEEITTTTVQDETTITPTDDTPQTTSSDGVITTTEQVAPETTEDVSPISTTNAPITTGTPTIGPTPFCDYKVDGPHQLGDGSKIGDVLVRSNMEISFDLTLSSSCTGTSCHILRIGHANSQERVPLIEILDGTNAIRMAYSDAQHSNSGHSIDHADVKAAVVDGQKHHYYFKFHPTQRIFELDNVRYLDESDGPYDTSSYDGQTYPMYAVDDIEFGQSLVDAVIENICVISRDLVELPTVTTTTAPTNNPTTTTTDAPITLSPSTTSVPPSTTEQECQYELVPQVLNWWTAEAYCQSQFEDNGHLMSIHNLKEAKLAHKLCDTEAINPGLGALPILQNDTNCCCWIGLNDYVTEGVFLWSDDSENDYENWYGDGREGELIADEEDCAVVTDWTNKWFDRSCLSSSHIGGFICQYGCDKAPKTTTTGLPTTTETIAPTDDVITTQETTAIETTVEDIVTTDADTTATPQTTQEVVDTTAVPPDTTDTPQTTVEDVITTRSDVPQTTAEEESTTTTDVPGTTAEDIVTTGVTPTDVPETTAEDIA
eukprot:1033336_1